ncbi:hypothetical protein SSPO_055840 [Streptomyces antimycoticus]|uniref:Beta-ketoacyl synthase-like N-terminal domain-containing protein n=1 Tax=Streptomyces antimycoticus TaxID=68175 RepID=A0A499V3B7_9ACTN|nr:hypothetical protein SSPO_055840 [Streptomyces antimycoticus]
MSWAVTGMGAVAGVGGDVDELFHNLCAGRSGVAELRGFDHALHTAHHAYEVDNRPAPGVDVTRRATGLLLDAVGQAVRDAGLDESDLSGVPVLVGTGLRELRSVELWRTQGAEFPAAELHFGTALREAFQADDTHTLSNACSAGLYALALGVDLLAQGRTRWSWPGSMCSPRPCTACWSGCSRCPRPGCGPSTATGTAS